jgi:hypothetical protein
LQVRENFLDAHVHTQGAFPFDKAREHDYQAPAIKILEVMPEGSSDLQTALLKPLDECFSLVDKIVYQ